MKFEELLSNRQSDRKYLPDPVDREDILRCLQAARLAPSACNSQPWKFVVIEDPDRLKVIAEAAVGMGMNKFAVQVPVFIAVVLEKMNFTATIGSMVKNKDFSLIDLGFAIDNFCLQAAELDLGTCVMGWFDEKKVRKAINSPGNRRIPLLIALGHPAGSKRNKIRKSLEEMSSWDEY